LASVTGQQAWYAPAMSQDLPPPDPFAPASAPQKPKVSTSVKVLIGCALMVPLFVCCAGVGSAVAIPAFIRFVKGSKAAEAPVLLGELSESVRARCAEGLPTVSAGPLPQTPVADKQSVDFGADPGFAALRFAPPDPVYFSYAVVSVGDGSSLLIAAGDLDEDGDTSRFTIECSAACECGEIRIERELE
jgi:hypothetical protein